MFYNVRIDFNLIIVINYDMKAHTCVIHELISFSSIFCNLISSVILTSHILYLFNSKKPFRPLILSIVHA